MLNIENNTPDNTFIFRFTGRMDTIACQKHAEEINASLDKLKKITNAETVQEADIIFDLAGVEYISSSFIRICISTAKQVRTGQFTIINCDPFIKKTFKIAGLDDLLNVS